MSAPPLRIGHGFDAHALVAGRRLVLGGVTIPHSRGLAGHSVADVLLHAICDAGYALGNLDATRIAQAPRLASHTAQMVTNIAADCGVPREHVNVKATTTDHLGCIGRAEGIAALATVLLVRAEGAEG